MNRASDDADDLDPLVQRLNAENIRWAYLENERLDRGLPPSDALPPLTAEGDEILRRIAERYIPRTRRRYRVLYCARLILTTTAITLAAAIPLYSSLPTADLEDTAPWAALFALIAGWMVGMSPLWASIPRLKRKIELLKDVAAGEVPMEHCREIILSR